MLATRPSAIFFQSPTAQSKTQKLPHWGELAQLAHSGAADDEQDKKEEEEEEDEEEEVRPQQRPATTHGDHASTKVATRRSWTNVS